MKMNTLKILIVAPLVWSASVFAGPKDVREDIKAQLTRLNKPHAKMMSESQTAVAEALEQYTSALSTCELSLLAAPSGKPGQSVAAVDEAPTWLIEAARQAFIENVELDPATLAIIQNHKFLTEVNYSFNRVATLVDEPALRKQIQRALIDTVPMQNDIGQKLEIRFSHMERHPLSNTVSFKLQVVYDNGETRMLQFRKTPVGTVKVESRVAQLVVAAIHHRKILSDESNLRQEMNAVRFNILKLTQMVPRTVAGRLNLIAEAIEKNQPRSGFFTGLLNGNTWFNGTDTMMGQAFATLLLAKEELIEMAQRAKEEEVKAARAAGRKASASDVVFVPTSSKVADRGRTASGYYAQRPQAAPARPQAQASRRQGTVRRDDRRRDDESEFTANMIWIMDPTYMLTRPWYWGTKDGTFYSHWMMYDWISDRSRRATEEALRRHDHDQDHHRQQSVFQPERPYDSDELRRFDRPVAPSGVSDRGFDQRSGVAAGAAAGSTVTADSTPRVERSDDLGEAWSRVTGEPATNVSTPSAPPVTRDLGEAESARFKSGKDGSEWGSAPKEETAGDDFKTVGKMEDAPREKERDPSIRGY